MVVELSNLLPDFPGATNQTCCFLHVLNLVVKSILWQFDVPKMNNEVLDDALDELAKLAGNIKQEEAECREVNSDEGDDDDDNVDGWIDERANMTDEEKEELDEAVQPIHLVLTKVFLYFLHQGTVFVGYGYG